MLRRLLAGACVAGVLACGSSAAAQTAPPAPGLARLHFRTSRERDVATVYVRTLQNGYAFLCSSPCTTDLPPGAELRITIGDEDEGRVMTVPNDRAGDVDVEVRPPGKGAVVGGVIMLPIGGILLLAGAVLTAVSADRGSSRGGELAGGLVCLALGGGLVVGGILLLANRSHEPRLKQVPHRSRERYSRDQTVLGDLAAGEHHDPLAFPQTAIAPLPLAFTF
jgi:hypothetical protein